MRAVIATLQDLEFVIDNADSHLGVITATKLKNYHLHMTVKVDDRSSGQISVRLQMSTGVYQSAENVYVQMTPIAEGVYQEFFTSLQKNLFLRSFS